MADPSQAAVSPNGILLMLASILLGSAAQLVIKLGLNSLPSDLDILVSIPWNSVLWVMLGLSAYGLSMLAWMMALANYDLSFAYPMLSTSYILVYLGAVLLPQLNETVSINKTIGILLIVAGVVLVTRSHCRKAHE